MKTLLETFQGREEQLWTALLQHIELSFISLLIAVVIAVPLAIYLSHHRKAAAPVIQVAAVFQTIPSLALLGLLIPIVGIGSVPATIALVLYALLPILRNTYTGMVDIDPSLIEAADAMGMNTWRKLIKVQLPMALPVIMAGIRTAMVLIVGTATIAALIGAGGLGDLILLGIDRGNNTLILLGAIPAALLAIAFDFLLGKLERISLRKTLTVISVGLGLIVLLIMIPWLSNEQKEITIGGKLGAEPTIIMNMYKELIEDQTDISVALKPNLGKTTFNFQALQSGEIDLYTEYTGTVLATFLDESAASTDQKEVYEQARKGLEEQYDMTLTEPMAFNNTYTLAVTPAFAEQYDLQTISDLLPIQQQVKAGFTLEFTDRDDGYPGLQKLYGLNFTNLNTMEPSIRYQAVGSGDINLVDAYATESEMETYHLIQLEDDKGLFPPYQGAALIKNETLETYPELKSILDQLGDKITDKEMREMNYAVDVEDRSEAAVAHDYLIKEGLIQE
ncbi:ABC transporter permease/substrate-binding protein [Pisciglobus halotolerans]|uniref:Osmoprotectant transport system permease protein n=1 Tax=Pisciglobus halotolerans TaxID=745365 RepID=A0A1I3CV99_9LACT|nr:ABC transporter permease/substrate-binding protein [Pisciglobus halotolerans]SFH78159.1 osmoprotectant transport system permease protein [Pisciglobus halotolerans]